MAEKTVSLIKVDSNANNNKFYRVEMGADDSVTVTYGRVGTAGTKQRKGVGQTVFDRVIREKTRKGYVENAGIVTADGKASGGNGKASLDNARLESIASIGLSADKDNKVVADLIKRIAAINKHQILEASGGKIQVSTSGQVSTALGIVDQQTIRKARDLLSAMAAPNARYSSSRLDQYLSLIPQQVPYRRGWGDVFLTEVTTVQKQRDLLDQLEASHEWYKNQVEAAAKVKDDGTTDDTDYSDFFKYRIREATPDEFKRIKDKYDADKNNAHAWASLRPKRAFVLINNDEDEKKWEAAKAAHGNVQNFWHGTLSHNLLSILRRGLIAPGKASTAGFDKNGAMFGPGIYLSNQSSKSLGYAHGYWSGGRHNNCFMFLTETVMGSEYRPTSKSYDSTIPQRARTEKNKFGKPYNSISVKAGYAGVRNHEAIVWESEQVALRYLVEFDA